MEHALFCKNSLIIQEQDNGEGLEALSRMRERDPNMCFLWKNPPSWNRGTSHWQHVEPIMHLVFHGIQKSMAHKIKEWASHRGSLSSFKKYSLNILQLIQDLKLEWYKIQPYTGSKFGGWVVKTHLAHGGPNFPNLLQIGKIVPNLQKQIGKAIANWERLNFLQIGKFFPNLQLSQFVESQIGNLVPNLHK